ncbi:uncharacterized protein LOC110822721 [Carica papaya]|uniref:uncharacterized protein LOC110822721 n=1 Tax=Carica papaya TaxID=3649 RepID=UPI000B8C8978|nr:uncharacterized protein LOC110822721 [Carica papaya]
MASSDESFPEAAVREELNPGDNKDFKVDPVSSEISTSMEIKEQTEAAEIKKAKEKKDAMQTLKRTILISAVVVAVAGAAFAITKKLREK